MSWVRVSSVCNKDRIKQLDAIIIPPVSRSQVIDALLEYSLKSPEFLKALINNELEKINAKING